VITTDFFLGVLLTLVAFRLLVSWKEHRLLYRRSTTFRAHPEEEGLKAEDVSFCTEDGANLHGWWFPHPEAKGVLLICHGNAGNISDRLWMPKDLADIPVHIFLFDYRGFGKSRGLPREKATERDVRAAYQVCVQKWGGSDENPPIVLYGRSLGGAVALQAVQTCPVRALILESTFTSVLEMGRRFYPWLLPNWFCMNRYRSDLRIVHATMPTLIAHSPDDEVVPFDMGETLYNLAPNPRGFIRLAGLHDDAGWQTCYEYASAFRHLIEEVIP
jgi:pimeloyl-ACP methyl ester carboxylesterase